MRGIFSALTSLCLLFGMIWFGESLYLGKWLTPKQTVDFTTYVSHAYGGDYVIRPMAHIFGYEYRCYDLHGGDACRFEKLTNAEQVQGKDIRGVLDVFQCKTDIDCGITQSNGCAVRTSPSPTTENDGRCVCLTGPVMFGCVPKDQVPQQ